VASPESLVKAFAAGFVEAMLGAEKTDKKTRPVVVKTDDVRAAVRSEVESILRPLIAEDERPAQSDLFAGLGGTDDYAERQMAAARARAEAQGEEPDPLTYDPNAPGSTAWASPSSG